jgi:hypothetical protein
MLHKMEPSKTIGSRGTAHFGEKQRIRFQFPDQHYSAASPTRIAQVFIIPPAAEVGDT